MRLGVTRGSYSRVDVDGDIRPEDAPAGFVDRDWLVNGECNLRDVVLILLLLPDAF